MTTSAFQLPPPAGPAYKLGPGASFDGTNAVITPGSSGSWTATYNGSISGWYISGRPGETGSATIDVRKGTTPASITGSGIPSITTFSGTVPNATGGVTGWGSTTFVVGDILTYVVLTCTGFTFLAFENIVTPS